eukprot:scaffold8626_cov225-Isochrysis_galbana.AAC.3
MRDERVRSLACSGQGCQMPGARPGPGRRLHVHVHVHVTCRDQDGIFDKCGVLLMGPGSGLLHCSLRGGSACPPIMSAPSTNHGSPRHMWEYDCAVGRCRPHNGCRSLQATSCLMPPKGVWEGPHAPRDTPLRQ